MKPDRTAETILDERVNALEEAIVEFEKWLRRTNAYLASADARLGKLEIDLASADARLDKLERDPECPMKLDITVRFPDDASPICSPEKSTPPEALPEMESQH